VSTGTDQLLDFWRRSVRLAVAVTLAAGAALWVLWPQEWLFEGRALALGLVLGSAAGVARFRLSLRTLLKGPTSAGMVRARLLGYGISAAALLVAFLLRDAVSPWACAVGLLMMNAALVITDWRDRRKEPPTTDAETAPEDDAGPANNPEA
jgi:hypothetical protein